jgi:methyl-accepting chemotaxis protein
MFRSLGLEKKSVLMLAVLLFLAVGINTGVLTMITAGKYKSVLLSKGISVGESFKGDLDKALNLGIPLEYMDDLDQRLAALLAEDETLAFAAVTDGSGKILFHTDEAQKGANFDGDLEDISLEEPLVREKKTAYEIIVPLVDAEGKRAGMVVLGIKPRVIKEQIYGLLGWAAGVGGISFLVFVYLVYLAVSKFITRPIMEMEKASKVIASGDLTRQVLAKGEDEIAMLGNSINDMATNIKAIISEINEITGKVTSVSEAMTKSSDKVLDISDTQQRAVSDTATSIEEMKMSISSIGQSSKSLTESAEDASSAVSQMSSSISKVAESADTFNQMSESAAASIEEMIASVREIATSIESLSASSEEVASALLQVNATIKEIQHSADESVKFADTVSVAASEKGMKSADTAMEGMRSIKKSVGALSEVINKLGSHSEAIGNVVTVIDEVTDQTTLLSLNAAILAAQAGEHGSGFAVVASEIKALADRTTMSTKEITELISTVQSEVRSSVNMAAEGLKSVEAGMKLVSEVSTALRSIEKSSHAATDIAKAIQRATSEEARAITQITEATNNMTKQVSHITSATQEQSRGGQQILEAVENIRSGASHIKNATYEQIEGSKQIDIMAEKVHNHSEQIEGAITEQQDRSNDIVRSIGSIQQTAEDLILAANEMRKAAIEMEKDSDRLSSEIKRFVI